MVDTNSQNKIAKFLLGIDALIFIMSGSLLLITAHLPNILLKKPGVKLYLALIFVLFLIMFITAVLGIYLIGILAKPSKKVKEVKGEYHG